MPEEKAYLLDANVFIEAKRRYYAFDLCPGFWECLIWHHEGNHRILSIDKVKNELDRGGDELKDWADAAPVSCFASTNESSVISEYGRIMNWVQAQAQYKPAAKREFAQGADGWLIAHAKVHGLTLVTHEALAPEACSTLPMPNVCEVFAVSYVDTFDMLRDLETSFTWEPSA